MRPRPASRKAWATASLPLAGPRIESCSGGGGRLDLAMLARTDQVWASDNIDAADRLRIQHGFTQLYPAGVLEAWVTDSPNTVTGRRTPLAFRFHVARLRPPDADGLCALRFADRDVVLFAFRETPRMGFGVPQLPLAGLPRTARYRATRAPARTTTRAC